ncbi:MAG: hypothetical protein RLZZ273_618 [Bacteroidota bacterium]|jgi:hypothetical protein
MYKNILASIPGIEYYPIVALLLFFGFFTTLICWFFIVDKRQMSALSARIIPEDVPVTSSSFLSSQQGE